MLRETDEDRIAPSTLISCLRLGPTYQMEQTFPPIPHLVFRRGVSRPYGGGSLQNVGYWPIFTALPRASYLYFSLLIYCTAGLRTRNKVLATHWGVHTERGHTHTHIEVQKIK